MSKYYLFFVAVICWFASSSVLAQSNKCILSFSNFVTLAWANNDTIAVMLQQHCFENVSEPTWYNKFKREYQSYYDFVRINNNGDVDFYTNSKDTYSLYLDKLKKDGFIKKDTSSQYKVVYAYKHCRFFTWTDNENSDDVTYHFMLFIDPY